MHTGDSWENPILYFERYFWNNSSREILKSLKKSLNDWRILEDILGEFLERLFGNIPERISEILEEAIPGWSPKGFSGRFLEETLVGYPVENCGEFLETWGIQ